MFLQNINWNTFGIHYFSFSEGYSYNPLSNKPSFKNSKNNYVATTLWIFTRVWKTYNLAIFKPTYMLVLKVVCLFNIVSGLHTADHFPTGRWILCIHEHDSASACLLGRLYSWEAPWKGCELPTLGLGLLQWAGL